MVGFGLLVFAFTILGLMELPEVERRMKKLESQHPQLKLSEIAGRIAGQFRTYILIRSVASILTGFVTFCFAFLVGLDLAPAWGMIAFVLNYIPFLGPLAAVVLTTLFAAAQFESLQATLIVLAGLSVIQFSIGSYLEPLLAGATLAVSPFLDLAPALPKSANGQPATMQTSQRLDATHGGELFPVNESEQNLPRSQVGTRTGVEISPIRDQGA
jgi:predicted PurR-regulated permease PerM